MVERDTLIAYLAIMGFTRDDSPLYEEGVYDGYFLRGKYKTLVPICLKIEVFQRKSHIVERWEVGRWVTVAQSHHGEALRWLKDNIERVKEVHNVTC